jgi:hypothetical protein
MPFDKNNLDWSGAGSVGAGARAVYKTADNKAAVKAANYFNAAWQQFQSINAILIVASDATFEAKVSVNGTTGVVTLAALDAFA